MSTDRNLLFGILAVQMNFISRDALIAAMHAWVLDKHKPLGDILAEHGQLGVERRQLLDAVVLEHLKAHGGDAQQSLAALASVESVEEALATSVPDEEVQHTLAHVRPKASSAAETPAEGTQFYERNPQQPPQPRETGSRFRILRPYAKGGLGEVFVAEDTELHREVALKEIQGRWAADRHSRGRFVLEAEITGGLEHPGIVPVYGLGAYADGRPFYAMRFIRGDSLKEAIDRFHRSPPADAGEYNLAFRNLLKRFIDVCNAIAYAHSRGILHRDLKPGNIMLGKYGETLVVDWGLGKPIGRPEATPDSGERTLHPSSSSSVVETQAGVAIGTPAFMSPEQAAGRLDQLGPASDVYSLGATLYVLLSGQAPFVGEAEEVLPKVEQGDFQPPRQVRADVPPALDAVVRKAMATRPADRYADALALAADVEHFLADEPVGAYPEPLAARLRRWGRKHRPLVAGLAALLVTAVAGLGIGLYLVNAEKDRTERARQDEANQRNQAEQARDLARGRFKLALAAFNDMVFGIQNKLEDRPGTHELRKELLEKARDGLKKLLQEAEAERNPDHTLLSSHLRMGDVLLVLGDTAAAEAEYRTGHSLAERLAEADPTNAQAQRDLGFSFERLGNVTLRLGQTNDALGYYRRSLEVRQRLPEADPKNTQAQRDLSFSFNRLGDVTLQLGQTNDALDYYRRSLEVRQRLAEADPKNTHAQRDLSVSFNRLGDVTLQLGQTDDALDYYRRSLEVRQRLAEADPKSAQAQRDLSVSFDKLGDVTLQLGQTSDALGHYRQSLEVHQRLAEADPKSAQVQRDLSVSFDKLGDVTLQLGQTKDAIDFYRQNQQIAQRLAEADPKNAQAQRDLSISFEKLGNVTLQLGQTKGALDYYRRGLQVRQALAEADPKNAQTQRDLSILFNDLGDVTLRLGQTNDALDYYRRGLEVRQRLAEADPKNAQAQRDLSVSFIKLGDVALKLGQTNDALGYYRRGLEVLQRLPEADPKNTQAQRDLSFSFIKLGDVTLKLGQTNDALDYYRRGLEVRQRLAEADPKNAQAQRDLGISFEKLGTVTLQLGQTNDALGYYRRSLEVRQPLAEADPKNAQAQRDLGFSFEKLGTVTLRLGQTKDALDYYRQSLEIRQKLATADPKDAQAQRDLAVSFERLGLLHEQGIRYAEAAIWFEKELELIRKWPDPKLLNLNTAFPENHLRACRNADKAVADPAAAKQLPAAERGLTLALALSALLAKKDVAKALQAAELLAEAATRGGHLYGAACGYARGATLVEKPEDKEKHARRAVELLKQAVAKGYKDVAHIKQDSDLDSLRQRDDFKQFLQELEPASKKK